MATIKVANAQVWVHDQDEALDFWTNKVGFEVRQDITLAELGDFRWLTVGAPGQDVSITLMAIPGPPVMDEDTKGKVEELMAKGSAGTVFLDPTGSIPSSATPPATPSGWGSRASSSRSGQQADLPAGALRADQGERLLLGDRQGRGPALPRPGRAPQRQKLEVGRSYVGPSRDPEPGLAGYDDIDAAPLGRLARDRERLGAGHGHLDGPATLPHVRSTGALRTRQLELGTQHI
jgi:catechol 2,3-dioxygenase-like lactoylglutathione lyase family enzyme